MWGGGEGGEVTVVGGYMMHWWMQACDTCVTGAGMKRDPLLQ